MKALRQRRNRRRANLPVTAEGNPLPGPLVQPIDQPVVEIEDVSEDVDGTARVGPGYVILVHEVDTGDRATIEVTEIRENFNFASWLLQN